MIYGLLNLSLIGNVMAGLLVTHLSIICVTIYLHRSQAHRALDLHPVVAHIMRFWLWLSTGMVTREWVAVHRKHHASCELEGDPHSPQLFGLSRVLWRGVGLYRRATQDKALVDQYSHGTPNDWIDRHLYQKHTSKGYAILLVAYLILFGLPGLLIWLLQMAWIPFWAAGVINGVGHYFGYRNFETPDAARNIVPWGVIIGGEELHSNHHAFSSSAKFSLRWWEFDLGWFYICVLQFFGLAKVKRMPPKLHSDPERHHLDVSALKAILSNRFRIMSVYAHHVLKPVFQEARSHADSSQRPLFKRKILALLHKEESLVKGKEKEFRENFLDVCSDQLKTVYQFKLRLGEIWQSALGNQDDILGRLQDWCADAESSGIEVLSQFSKKLKTYS